MIFRILLSKSESHEAAVELHAESADEAERMAKERADGGMVNWVKVYREMVTEVSPVTSKRA